jgi:Zn-dependent protease/CBS domain-containing protein
MTWSFPIGRLLGSELRVHATFFLLLLWIGVAAYVEGGWNGAAVNIAFILALFACVVAHEFGHALMARRYGIRTPDITLLPIGGLARLEKMPEKPGQEILVALAGPGVNVVIWFVLVFVFGARIDLEGLENLEDPSFGFFAKLAAVNLFLVLFNMIPAFPMDGGRVFRAILAIPMGRVRATRAAARAGQVIAFLFGFFGLTTGNLLLMLIAIFVFAAAAAESSDVSLREVARGMAARDAMITAYEALGPEDGIAAMSSGLLRTTQHEFPVLDRQGRLLGFVTRNAIYAAAQGEDRQLRAGDVMTEGIPEVELAAPLTEVLEALGQPGTPAVGIVDRAGNFLGYVTRENIGELVVLRGQ